MRTQCSENRNIKEPKNSKTNIMLPRSICDSSTIKQNIPLPVIDHSVRDSISGAFL